MAASRRSNLLMLQCSIVSKKAYRCNRGVPFQEAYRLRQSHGPEQGFKPRFRRPDRARVDGHRQFARVPGSLACHLVQLGRWPRQSASGEGASPYGSLTVRLADEAVPTGGRSPAPRGGQPHYSAFHPNSTDAPGGASSGTSSDRGADWIETEEPWSRSNGTGSLL